MPPLSIEFLYQNTPRKRCIRSLFPSFRSGTADLTLVFIRFAYFGPVGPGLHYALPSARRIGWNRHDFAAKSESQRNRRTVRGSLSRHSVAPANRQTQLPAHHLSIWQELDDEPYHCLAAKGFSTVFDITLDNRAGERKPCLSLPQTPSAYRIRFVEILLDSKSVFAIRRLHSQPLTRRRIGGNEGESSERFENGTRKPVFHGALEED